MEIDFTRLKYFLAVADELHFKRAADRLHIGQSVSLKQVWRTGEAWRFEQNAQPTASRLSPGTGTHLRTTTLPAAGLGDQRHTPSGRRATASASRTTRSHSWE